MFPNLTMIIVFLSKVRAKLCNKTDLFAAGILMPGTFTFSLLQVPI